MFYGNTVQQMLLCALIGTLFEKYALYKTQWGNLLRLALHMPVLI